MGILILLSFASLVLGVPATTSQGLGSKTGLNYLGTYSGNGRHYFAVRNSTTHSHEEANTACQSRGMELVSWKSQEEVDFIKNLVLQNPPSKYWTAGVANFTCQPIDLIDGVNCKVGEPLDLCLYISGSEVVSKLCEATYYVENCVDYWPLCVGDEGPSEQPESSNSWCPLKQPESSSPASSCINHDLTYSIPVAVNFVRNMFNCTRFLEEQNETSKDFKAFVGYNAADQGVLKYNLSEFGRNYVHYLNVHSDRKVEIHDINASQSGTSVNLYAKFRLRGQLFDIRYWIEVNCDGEVLNIIDVSPVSERKRFQQLLA